MGNGKRWYASSVDDALETLQSQRQGLTEAEARARLERYGPNVIQAGREINPWMILLHQFASPLIYILLVAMVITMAIRHWADTIVIGIILALNASIGFFQEYRAENSMRALLGLTTPRATVRRDGREERVRSEELAPGDIVLLESGDVVPADLRLLESRQLRINESLLTGESLPAAKSADTLAPVDLIPGDQDNMAFMGTAVSSGRGVGVVVVTAGQTQIGGIASEIQETQRTEAPLRTRMSRFGRWISVIIVATSALAFGVGLALGEALVDMFLTAVAVAVAAIPEGLPVVMTIALAVGVRRMAQRKAIVRRLPAVETLGSCTVIVSDKTGTLTQNQMTVEMIWAGGSSFAVSGKGLDLEGELSLEGRPVKPEDYGALQMTLLAGVLSNEAELRQEDGRVSGQGDPTEVALLVAGAKAGMDRRSLLQRYPQVHEVPFEPELRFSASIHRSDEQEIAFVKGAPERVLDMCDTWLIDGDEAPLDGGRVAREVQRLAEEGLRVLAMAMGTTPEAAESVRQGKPSGLTFLGLQGMMDPPREGVIEAVAACRRAGIRVIMVTGDHASTAAIIARSIGSVPEGKEAEVKTGSDLEGMSDEAFAETLRQVSVYARVSPAQKLRIVNTLREQGEIVAVTGDGVNDAPALKSAHLGAAMGRSGTDVAKEASEMVLTDDNFATIYAAVEEGRTAFSNIRKATFFLISSGAAALVVIIASLMLGMPLPMLPAQILWMNVVTNGVQDVALAFEPGEEDLFRQPPRDPKENIISGLFVERTVMAAVVLASGTLAMFEFERGRGATDSYARVVALTTMVLFQFFHVGNCRSEHLSIFKKSPLKNPFLLYGATGALAIHIGATYFGATQTLLSLEPLDWSTWWRMALTATSIILVMEMHKWLRRPAFARRG